MLATSLSIISGFTRNPGLNTDLMLSVTWKKTHSYFIAELPPAQ